MKVFFLASLAASISVVDAASWLQVNRSNVQAQRSSRRAALSLSQSSFSVVGRGGATGTPDAVFKQPTKDGLKVEGSNVRLLVWGVLGAGLASVLYVRRDVCVKVFDRHWLQQETLKVLKRLDGGGPARIHLYVIGLACWELAGLSTVPVETAAGMVFGWERALVASGGGKLLGAVAAFLLGRHVLSDWSHSRMAHRHTMKLIAESIAAHPLRDTFLIKYSCFPELVKNFGSSLFTPIRFWMFLLATIVHGGLYTVLWTFFGHDTAQRLADPNLPTNLPLQIGMVVGLAVGLIGCPLLMAWWIRDMKRQAAQK